MPIQPEIAPEGAEVESLQEPLTNAAEPPEEHDPVDAGANAGDSSECEEVADLPPSEPLEEQPEQSLGAVHSQSDVPGTSEPAEQELEISPAVQVGQEAQPAVPVRQQLSREQLNDQQLHKRGRYRWLWVLVAIIAPIGLALALALLGQRFGII